ncbi:hypothetical protein HY374_03440 [Candidatus Berkelbacteria bacterium]|nr:hypothetical protein [Candidatus Berkelbacteria bacterium]
MTERSLTQLAERLEAVIARTQRVATISLFVSCLLFLTGLPGIEATVQRIAVAQAQEATPDAANQGDPVGPVDLSSIDLRPKAYHELAALNAQLGVLADARRRIELDAVDRDQFDIYLTVEQRLLLYPEDQRDEMATKVMNELRDELSLDTVSKYDRRLVRSILNEVTAKAVKGAGHEYLRVARLTKDHRTKSRQLSTESIPPPEDEPRESQHYRERGQAVDVSELDTLRGTQFTIEYEVDQEGKPVIKDGKPVEKVVDIKHLPLEPVQFVWQSDEAAGLPGALPGIFSESPHNVAQQAAEGQLAAVLGQEADTHGKELIEKFGPSLSGAQNLADAAKLVGDQVLKELGESTSLNVGPNGPLRTGQEALSEATGGLPSYGFYGSKLEGGLDSMLNNLGREVVTGALKLPQGAMIGEKADEIAKNVGERHFEVALGQLPLGTLDGVTSGDRQSLEVRVGRGVAAKFFNLFVADLPFGATREDWQGDSARALAYEFLKKNPTFVSNAVGLGSADLTKQFIDGAAGQDAWFAAIGQARLKVLESYTTSGGRNRRDAALNIDERPPLTELMETGAGKAGAERAAALLDTYSFPAAARSQLESMRAGATFFADDAELRAFLIDNAYLKGYNADATPRTDRFLAADTSVFAEVGIDQMAKGAVAENGDRAAMREFLRTGDVPSKPNTTTPALDLDLVASKLGLRSRAELVAALSPKGNAPLLVWETTGRRILLTAVSDDTSTKASTVAASRTDRATARERITTLRQATQALHGALPRNERAKLDVALASIDELASSVESASDLFQLPKATAWVNGLATLYQAGQSVAGANSGSADEYRTYALALGELADGNAGRALYTLEELSIGSPLGYQAVRAFTPVITGTKAPTAGVIDFGHAVIDQAGGFDPGTSAVLHGILDEFRPSRGGRASAEGLATALATFTTRNRPLLAEAGSAFGLSKIGYGLDGSPLDVDGTVGATRGTALAQGMTHLLVGGTLEAARAGADQLDRAFGIQGYEFSKDLGKANVGTFGLLSTQGGAGAESTLKAMQGDQKLFQLLTGRTNANLSEADRADAFFTGMMTWTGDQVGFTYDPDIETMVKQNGGYIGLLTRVTGESPSVAVRNLNIPIIGDVLADQQALEGFVRGELFDGNSSFWKNQQYLGRLDGIAAAHGLPAGAITALFDHNLTKEQQETLLKGSFKNYLGERLTPGFVNDLFGLEGTDAAIAADALRGFSSILLDDNVKDKNGAMKELGLLTLDRYMSANYGITVSWLADNTLSQDQKVKLGMRTVSRAMNLDPALTTLAETAYEVFYVNGGLDTTTAAGRSDLAKLVTATGQAAGLPGQYTVLAAAALTGDVETTLVSYAGSQFIDQQLAAFGVTDVGFGDLYEAFVSPLPGTEALAYQQSWDFMREVIDSGGDVAGPNTDFNPEDPDAFLGVPTVSVIGPDGQETSLRTNEADFLKVETERRLGLLREERQRTIQYALGDSLLNKALGDSVPGINVRGMTKAMFEGTASQKLDAFGSFLGQASGSPEAAAIFGSLEAAQSLSNFFGSDKNVENVSASSLTRLDGWLTGATGWDVPPGTTGAILAFMKTGSLSQDVLKADGTVVAKSFDSLLQSDYTKFQIGGFLDQSIGLPQGTSFTVWQSFDSLSKAQAAYDTAREQLFNASGGIGNLDFATGELTQAQEAFTTAQTNLQLTTAQVVTTAVNLVLGPTFAKLDGQLGLPSGTISMLVTAAITALIVPGIAFAQIAASIIAPWLAGLLLGSLLGGGGGFLGGLFGKKTQKVKRVEILWSYRVSDPGLFITPVDAQTKEPLTLTLAEREAKTNLLYKKMKAAYDAKPEEQRKLYEPKPLTELDRGEWPEEVWFADPKDPGANAERDPANTKILHPGIEIALNLNSKDAKLPAGVFRGNTKEQFLAGAKQAAKTKIAALIGDLVTLPKRLKEKDDRMLPAQIWTHDVESLRANEQEINEMYGEGAIGSYQQLLDDERRKGVGYDEKVPLLTRWVHWQY